MTTNEILVDLIAIKEAPWGDLRGKPLNDRRLANRLRQYGVKSKQIRFGEKGLKGYYRADLIEAWERYLPPSSGSSDTSETSETSAEKPSENVSDVSLVSLLAGNGREPVQTFPLVCEHCGAPERPGKPVETYSVDGETYLLHPGCRTDWLDAPNPNTWSFNLGDADTARDEGKNEP